jgi:hypothetical protein
MIQGGGGARLALEALAPIRIARQAVRQHHKRYPAPEPRVVGEIDLAHPAAAEQPLDPVVADRGSDHVATAGCVYRGVAAADVRLIV